MGRRRKVAPHKTAAAAGARASRHPSSKEGKRKTPVQGPRHSIPDFPESELPDLEPISDSDGDNECSWDGGVNHIVSESEKDWKPAADEEGIGSDSDLSELEGPELVESLHHQLEREVAALARATPYEKINQPMSAKNWKKVEANRALEYTGHSERKKRRRAKEERSAAENKAASVKSVAIPVVFYPAIPTLEPAITCSARWRTLTRDPHIVEVRVNNDSRSTLSK
ncbi:hypothetical protein B0H10DRAFT_1963606 [Mycena sp. CBHHK59/15]|nr:hypothetical protein B0H10DRAFT_1963606 [Mycena sp. CBHHK59/15]